MSEVERRLTLHSRRCRHSGLVAIRWPRALDELDRRLGADPHERDRGLLACFEPTLPGQADVEPAVWEALRIRADERAREWSGPIGEWLRALDDAKVVTLDPWSGLVRDPRTGLALDRAQAELLVLRDESAKIARSNTAVDGSGSTPSSARAE
jgi:hypothetical protein